MARDQDTVEQYLRDHDRFYQRIWQNDDLGAVIRGVTYCEEFLRVVILKAASAPGAAAVDKKTIRRLERGKMMFGKKIDTAEHLRVTDTDFIASLRKLAEVRGGFGHELEKDLSPQEVEELVNSLAGRAKELFEQIQGATNTLALRLRWTLQSLKLTFEKDLSPQEVDELVETLSGRANEFFEQIQGGTATAASRLRWAAASRLRWALQSLKLTLEELAFPERKFAFGSATIHLRAALGALKVMTPGGTEMRSSGAAPGGRVQRNIRVPFWERRAP